MASEPTPSPPPPLRDGDRGFLTGEGARPLASLHRTRPYWSARTPRWVIRYVRRHNGYLSIPNYGAVISQVAEPHLGPHTATSGDPSQLPRDHLHVEHSRPEGTVLPPSFARYESHPHTVHLEPIQAVVKVHTTIETLYSNNFDQLEQQIDLAAEYLYEMQENLFFNHPTYGLLHNARPPYRVTAEGPPTPDLLDDMLGRVWIEPDLFAMHPEALHEFRVRASALGLDLGVVEHCGGRFSAWRGVPIFPTDKLHLLAEGAGHGSGREYQPVERSRGGNTSHVVLMRTGEEKQGVVGLEAAHSKGSERYPQISVEFMGISDDAVASYLMTMYVAAAVLTPNALCVARVTV